MRALRVVLLLDAFLLVLLGGALICAPGKIIAAFHFPPLPQGINYVIGLWGCVMLTMAGGYLVAAADPIAHLIWIQVAIARGVLEFALGLIYLGKGLITWQQGGFGIVVAGAMALVYVALYPKREKAIQLTMVDSATKSA